MRESRLQMPWTVPLSACDHLEKLGYADAFAAFQDLAVLHAEQLGVGLRAMQSRGLFWLTVKTRVRFTERPGLLDRVTLHTHPLLPDRLRSVREYRMERDGRTLVQGKTEWAVLETQSGKLHRIDDVFPPEVAPVREPEFDGAFARIGEDFSGARLLGTHRVCSSDVDLGQHMNNVAYLRRFLGLFSTRELDALPIREIELHFRSACHEGDELRCFVRDTEEGMEFAAFSAAERPALLGRICLETL